MNFLLSKNEKRCTGKEDAACELSSTRFITGSSPIGCKLCLSLNEKAHWWVRHAATRQRGAPEEAAVLKSFREQKSPPDVQALRKKWKEKKKTHLNMKSYSLLCRLFNFNDCHFRFPSISSQFPISILKTFQFSCSRLVSSSLCSSNSIFCPRWSGVRPNQLPNLIRCGQNFNFNSGSRCFTCFFCLFFLLWFNLLLLISVLCFSHNAPHQPTELAHTAGHPPTDYLCGRRRWRCTRVGEAEDACSWSKIPTLTCGWIILHSFFEETSSSASGALHFVLFFFFLLHRSLFLTRKCFVSLQFH